MEFARTDRSFRYHKLNANRTIHDMIRDTNNLYVLFYEGNIITYWITLMILKIGLLIVILNNYFGKNTFKYKLLSRKKLNIRYLHVPVV